MKNKKILNTLLSFLIGIALFACSNDSESMTTPLEEDDIPVFIDLKNTPLPDKLGCEIYIFSKADADEDYSLYANYTMTSSRGRIKLVNKDLATKAYRFLFVATSANNPEVTTLAKDGSSLGENSKWSNVMVRANKNILSDSSYYAVLDKTGEDILTTGNIQATLNRLVGQMTFDIYKVKGQSGVYQTDTVALPYLSVLDRVHKIEIEYFGRTKDVVFNATNQPVQHNLWENNYTQTIIPKLVIATPPIGSEIRIDTTQVTENLILSSIAKGSASLTGIYCMPSDANMKVKMTFHYYDTTPICEDEHQQHTKTCFTEKTIELNLPKENSGMPSLSIKPNHYTVNTARIRYNRVINVGTTTGFIFDTLWENEK